MSQAVCGHDVYYSNRMTGQGMCQTHPCSVRVLAWVLWPPLRAIANGEYFDDILYFSYLVTVTRVF